MNEKGLQPHGTTATHAVHFGGRLPFAQSETKSFAMMLEDAMYREFIAVPPPPRSPQYLALADTLSIDACRIAVTDQGESIFSAPIHAINGIFIDQALSEPSTSVVEPVYAVGLVVGQNKRDIVDRHVIVLYVDGRDSSMAIAALIEASWSGLFHACIQPITAPRPQFEPLSLVIDDNWECPPSAPSPAAETEEDCIQDLVSMAMEDLTNEKRLRFKEYMQRFLAKEESFAVLTMKLVELFGAKKQKVAAFRYLAPKDEIKMFDRIMQMNDVSIPTA